jgi:hypothetical protein
MVRDHQDYGIEWGQSNQLAHFTVDEALVVADGMLERIARHVFRMDGIHAAPEAVMDTVYPHLDEHEEVPGLGLHQVLRHDKLLFRLGIDPTQQSLLIGGTKILDVEQVAAGDALDLVLQLGGVGVLPLGRWREKVGHHIAVDRLGGYV